MSAIGSFTSLIKRNSSGKIHHLDQFLADPIDKVIKIAVCMYNIAASQIDIYTHICNRNLTLGRKARVSSNYEITYSPSTYP